MSQPEPRDYSHLPDYTPADDRVAEQLVEEQNPYGGPGGDADGDGD